MTVTICGSMRHIPEMLEWYEILSLEGYLVYLPVLLGVRGYNMTVWALDEQQSTIAPFPEISIHVPYKPNVDEELKSKLQQLHFQKISDSDFIFVVNPGGCIGEGTMAEIEFAKKHLGNLQTPIVYLEKPEWELGQSEGVWRK